MEAYCVLCEVRNKFSVFKGLSCYFGKRLKRLINTTCTITHDKQFSVKVTPYARREHYKHRNLMTTVNKPEVSKGRSKSGTLRYSTALRKKCQQ
jgi:hypothetical protein